MCPASVKSDETRGWIIPIGGGEKKSKSSTIMQRFVELAGGADARMAIIPTASQLEDAGSRTTKVFRDLGVAHVDIVPLDTRDDCEDPEQIAMLENATGIFFTGGNQLRLSTTIGGSKAPFRPGSYSTLAPCFSAS